MLRIAEEGLAAAFILLAIIAEIEAETVAERRLGDVHVIRVPAFELGLGGTVDQVVVEIETNNEQGHVAVLSVLGVHEPGVGRIRRTGGEPVELVRITLADEALAGAADGTVGQASAGIHVTAVDAVELAGPAVDKPDGLLLVRDTAVSQGLRAAEFAPT